MRMRGSQRVDVVVCQSIASRHRSGDTPVKVAAQLHCCRRTAQLCTFSAGHRRQGSRLEAGVRAGDPVDVCRIDRPQVYSDLDLAGSRLRRRPLHHLPNCKNRVWPL